VLDVAGRSACPGKAGYVNAHDLLDRHTYDQYNAIPSFDTTLGMAYDPTNPKATVAKFCGVKRDQICKNYGDQLFCENQNAVAGRPITPTFPETFTNDDFSNSHAFPIFSLFYVQLKL